MRTPSGLYTVSSAVSSASPYAGTTPRAVRTAESSRYARVYPGTSADAAIAKQNCRRLCQSRKHSEFTERSREDASDIDGQLARASNRERTSQTPYNNSLTSDFSSFSSATDASIFGPLKSFIGSPCTISHFPPRTRTGNDEKHTRF